MVYDAADRERRATIDISARHRPKDWLASQVAIQRAISALLRYPNSSAPKYAMQIASTVDCGRYTGSTPRRHPNLSVPKIRKQRGQQAEPSAIRKKTRLAGGDSRATA